MFEEDLFDAYQFLYDIGKQNTAAASSKDNDEEKKLGVSNSQPRYNDSQNGKGKQIYSIGVHKSKYTAEEVNEWTSSADEDSMAHNKSTETTKGFYNGVRSNIYRENVCPSVSGITINSPLIKELDKRGLLVKDDELMKTETESGNEGKTSAFPYRIFKRFTMESEAPPYSKDVDPVHTPEEIKCVHSVSKKNDTKRSCGEKDLINERFDSEQTETMKILTEAVKDINTDNDNVQQYLFFGKSHAKNEAEKMKSQQNIFSKREFKNQSLDHHANQRKNPDIKTLGDCLKYFNLFSYLQQIETSLEDVRRNKKFPADHEEFFKQIDKEIQKLSFKYHPDKVTNRGGTEEEVKTAQELQTAINATRNVLKFLNSAFLEDIGTEHKFGFYTKLDISLLNNEDEIKYRIYEVIFKIGLISRIKQQNIISEIRKFLIASKNCVHSYLGVDTEFEKYRDLALFHLKCCIHGFKKLREELEEVKEQCKSEKNSENMLSLIQNMENDTKRDLKLLKHLKKAAKSSLNGKYEYFSPVEYMDPYFVLPLVFYTNVILMCNVMRRNSSVFDRLNIYPESDPYYRDDLCYLTSAYYLASYCSGNKCHEDTVFRIMDKMKLVQKGVKVQLSKVEIECEFYNHIKNNDEYMEFKFKIEDYNEAVTSNLLMIDLKKCMTLMSEFQEKQEELSKGIEKFHKKAEKMDEKYERFDKMVEATEELDRRIKERLEKSKKLSEKVSDALSDQS